MSQKIFCISTFRREKYSLQEAIDIITTLDEHENDEAVIDADSKTIDVILGCPED